MVNEYQYCYSCEFRLSFFLMAFILLFVPVYSIGRVFASMNTILISSWNMIIIIEWYMNCTPSYVRRCNVYLSLDFIIIYYSPPTPGSSLLSVSASDGDGRDNTITYSLSGEDKENFTIDANGVITLFMSFPTVTDASVSYPCF